MITSRSTGQPFKPPVVTRILFLGFCLLAASLSAAEATRDLTFFLISDVHVGMQFRDLKPPLTVADYKKHITETLDVIATIPGKPWPKTGEIAEATRGLKAVPMPRGLIVAGDLTQGGNDAQWRSFEQLFPWQAQASNRFPVFACAGNHDGAAQTNAARLGLRARNQAMQKAGLLSALSEDGLHAAWVWQDVHFISLNLCPADEIIAGSKPGSMWDPERSLTFLRTYLAEAVPPGPTPIIIVQHFHLEPSRWWGQEQRRAFYESIKERNVVAILHGHTHAITHQLFPDEEEWRAFGGKGPRFDCFSAGALKVTNVKTNEPFQGWRHPCECYVFHLSNDRFLAAHYTGEKANNGWNQGQTEAALTVIKPMLPPPAPPQRK